MGEPVANDVAQNEEESISKTLEMVDTIKEMFDDLHEKVHKIAKG